MNVQQNVYRVIKVASECKSEEGHQNVKVWVHELNGYVVLAAWDDLTDLPNDARWICVRSLIQLLGSEDNRRRWTVILWWIEKFRIENATEWFVKCCCYKSERRSVNQLDQ